MLDGVFRHNHGPVTVVEVSNSLLTYSYDDTEYRVFNVLELSRNTWNVYLRQAQAKDVYSLIFPSFRHRRRVHRIG